MTNEFHHVTVLLHETVDMLDIKPDGIYVDATLGGAGHSSYLLSQLSEKGHLYCFDQDQKAIDNAQVRLKDYIDKGMVTFIKDNFRNLKSNLEALGVSEIDGILYDLGVSSPQLDERERGFSYKQDAKLDMRMNEEASLTAYDVVNTILTTIWCAFSSSMVRTSSLNRLHVRLNRLVRLNQLRPRRNWRKSLNQLSLLRN
jgi:S-adenosyl-methyltransferase mraW